jgi:hypothetical protein
MGFTSLLGMVIGIAGPYVVHLGQYDVRYPYAIMCLITFAGSISVISTIFQVYPAIKITYDIF